MRKIAINQPFWFFSAIVKLIRELVTSNMHNKSGKDTWHFFQSIAPTRSNYRRKRRKITIIRPFRIFSAITELVRELLISNMHNKFQEETWKTFEVIAPTMSNYWREMQKIVISAIFNFFRPLLNWSLVTCITNLGRIHEKLSSYRAHK